MTDEQLKEIKLFCSGLGGVPPTYETIRALIARNDAAEAVCEEARKRADGAVPQWALELRAALDNWYRISGKTHLNGGFQK